MKTNTRQRARNERKKKIKRGEEIGGGKIKGNFYGIGRIGSDCFGGGDFENGIFSTRELAEESLKCRFNVCDNNVYGDIKDFEVKKLEYYVSFLGELDVCPYH